MLLVEKGLRELASLKVSDAHLEVSSLICCRIAVVFSVALVLDKQNHVKIMNAYGSIIEVITHQFPIRFCHALCQSDHPYIQRL